MKYFISEFWYVFRSILRSKNDIRIFLKSIKSDGYKVVPGFLTSEHCADLIEQFDKHASNPKAWKDDKQSDVRLYGIEGVAPCFAEIFDKDSLSKLSSYYIGDSLNQMVLANKVQYEAENKGSGGGWHRDSINRRQLKFIIYLTDANLINGCFQYMPGTHSIWQKFFINRWLNKGLSSYRYTEEDIELLVEAGHTIDNVEGRAGDLIIVDTSGIHRGAPVQKGFRYAITNYMWDGKIPDSVKRLMLK